MKVLLLNQAFHPDIVATSVQASDLAMRLVERGHDVSVLCSRHAYDDPTQRYPTREQWKGVRITRLSSSRLGKGARWRRAVDFGSYMCNCMVHLASYPRADVVVALTSPPLISWLGALFARLKGGRFVFWVMDLNPDEAIAAGWLRRGSFTARVLDRLLHYSLKHSAAVVALDRFMAERLEAKGVERERIAILPPWSLDHLVRYDTAGRAEFRHAHQLADKFVVMYSGNHSPCHPLTTLLEAADRLKTRTDIAFCFVGGGSEFATVRRFANARGLANVKTIPYQPMATLSGSLSSADLHVVVMGEPFVGIIHPSKVYNIRVLGIPYLYIGPHDSHIAELNPDFSSTHGDVDAVVSHIERAANVAQLPPSPATGREEHGRDRLVNRMVATLEAAAAGAA